MPIRHFDIFTAERRLLQTSGVQQLKDTRLGIEGNYWLRKILGKDPAVTAMGGIPLKLKDTVENEIKAFKANNIQPIFVFPGLSILRKDKPFSIEDRRPSTRANGWDLYDKNRLDSALQAWGNGGGIHLADLCNYVCHILHEHGIEFIRAPYSAWAQLAYMYTHPRQIVSAVYGGTELLMFDVDKVITSIDFEKGNYMWMSKKTVLQDLHVSDDQFLDICLLAGFEYCNSFPPLNHSAMSMGFTFKDVHDLVKHHKTGFNTVQAYVDDPSVSKSHYVDMFCRARCVIKYHPIITDEGQVRPLNKEYAPNDIHEFIGYRLPDELYYYLMRGLISPQSINTLVSGVLIENAPLDNGDTTEYRNFLLGLLGIRTQTLSLLTQPLHQFYQSRKIASHFYFDPTTEHIMHHHPNYNPTSNGSSPSKNATLLNTVFESTRSWHVTQEVLDAEKKNQDTATVDIAFCMKATENETNAAKTISQTPSDKVLQQKDEIVANVLWKTLEIRDFLTSSKHIHTPWGHALQVALNTTASNKNKPSFHTQEALLTAMELIRFEVLTNKPYTKSYSRIAGDENDQRHIRLISRALSLLPMDIKPEAWKGPFDRDLLVFNSFIKALNKSYRNLCEMLVLSLFLNNLAEKERTDYFDIADSLPYASDVNVAMGLVTKQYLEHTLSSDAGVAIQAVESAFPLCKSVKQDLEQAFKFWDGLVAGLNAVKDTESEAATIFLEANEWLQKRRL
ncbi:xpg i-region protein [Lichtheimia corymbifera JMRC:FSU:9682]|uniref:Xpg i-region protein n=1 Tax=Lichtheimia corymbifera JMRC:FSU:9682 TaxID=1263082 RepID=A0A068SG55_9FUNG|nr:xpg i-region protein [Lichtheimia corymbifera JMRC:FSU:9682]